MISAVDEALGRHLKAIHFAAELCNVSDEVSVLVAFLSVSCVNVPLRWACELKQVDGFLCIITDGIYICIPHVCHPSHPPPLALIKIDLIDIHYMSAMHQNCL